LLWVGHCMTRFQLNWPSSTSTVPTPEQARRSSIVRCRCPRTSWRHTCSAAATKLFDFNDISFPSHYLPSRTAVLAIVFLLFRPLKKCLWWWWWWWWWLSPARLGDSASSADSETTSVITVAHSHQDHLSFENYAEQGQKNRAEIAMKRKSVGDATKQSDDGICLLCRRCSPATNYIQCTAHNQQKISENANIWTNTIRKIKSHSVRYELRRH